MNFTAGITAYGIWACWNPLWLCLRPESGDSYFHAFPFEMAAAYMFHIVQNHPFIDGNKRTGLAVCLYFLELHGRPVDAGPDELEQFVRAVAKGEIQKPEIAKFLEEHSKQ